MNQPRPFVSFLKQSWLLIGTPILAAFIFWVFVEREIHALSVHVYSASTIIDFKSKPISDLSASYRGTALKRLDFYEIEIENTGNKPIRRDDFDTPLKIEFSGTLISEPTLRPPPDLQPQLIKISPSAIELERVLLNPKDKIGVRVSIADLTSTTTPFKVTGRIVDISSIDVDYVAATESGTTRTWLLRISQVLATAVSLLAAILTLGRVFDVIALRRQVKVAVTLDKAVPKQASELRAHSLAKNLGIPDSDRKAFMFFLRVKIESLLSELCQKYGIPERPPGSRNQARELMHREIISADLVGAISDIMPILNREIHQIEPYVTEREFLSIEGLGGSIISQLEAALRPKT